MATLEKTTPRFKTRIEISEDTRADLIALLNQNLADLSDLYSQTKQAHWNVRGKDFQQLHELFDELAAKVLPFIDTVAERANILGGYATGTVRMAAENSRLGEFPTDATDGMAVVEVVADRWAEYAALAREAINMASELDEPTTEDVFTEVSRGIDLGLWFIEAHLQ